MTEATDGNSPPAAGEDVFTLSDRIVDDHAALRPSDATYLGIAGHDHEWDDRSPEGCEAVADRWRRLAADVQALPPTRDPWDRVAREVALDAAAYEIEWVEEDEYVRDVAHVGSFPVAVRDLFDMMDRSDDDGWANVVARLEAIHEPFDGYLRALAAGRDRGVLPARRQVEAVVEQLRAMGTDTGTLGQLRAELATAGPTDSALAGRADAGLAHAHDVLRRVADALETDALPTATERDGVGRDRYLRFARRYLGTRIDPEETYAWGWGLVRDLYAEIVEVARQIDPDRDIDGVATLLKTDAARAASSRDDFVAQMRALQERALADLADVHFDVPEPVRAIDVRLAPAGAPPGAWYVGPTEDWTRSGTLWWSVGDREQIPLYEEISTGYHEGFPGHHLQVGIQITLADRLSRLHRMLYWNPGYGEGWALYAERLMRELGYLDRPDYVFGQLTGSLLRAVRVVVDIGAHLDLPIPDDAPFHPGERWTFDLGVEMLERYAFLDHEYAESEMTRYLGLPAQAISYKVGERVLLDLREEVRRREGAAFDPRSFHARVLGSGPVGLDLLRELVLQ